jgi:hypothetical protein
MKKKTTYALLMRSEEKGRDLLETAVYAICILSAVSAIWQFTQQPVTLMADQSIGESYAAPQVSHQKLQPVAAKKS